MTITTISMGVGAAVLLTVGLLTQGLPRLDWQSWAIIVWLAVVNTAFAFTLWNVTYAPVCYGIQHHQQHDGDTDSHSGGCFLNETLTGREVVGLVIAIVGYWLFS